MTVKTSLCDSRLMTQEETRIVELLRDPYFLSERQKAIHDAIFVQGFTREEAAKKLDTSLPNVRSHIGAIYNKLGLKMNPTNPAIVLARCSVLAEKF